MARYQITEHGLRILRRMQQEAAKETGNIKLIMQGAGLGTVQSDSGTTDVKKAIEKGIKISTTNWYDHTGRSPNPHSEFWYVTPDGQEWRVNPIKGKYPEYHPPVKVKSE